MTPAECQAVRDTWLATIEATVADLAHLLPQDQPTSGPPAHPRWQGEGEADPHGHEADRAADAYEAFYDQMWGDA